MSNDLNECSKCTALETDVIDKNLCCGCGACVGVCPSGALAIDISISHQPVLDDAKCLDCGLCYAVCPGPGYPIVEWARLHCDGQTRMFPEQGPVRRYLRGHSNNLEIRQTSASGGVATSLLLHLLESNQVDEVAVIGMENERPVARLTSDPQVVLESMMSKYGPVPMLATLIPELRRRPRRIAMTVTPCQLAGWVRASERIPSLRESTVLAIGLFCGWIQSYDALTGIAATVGVTYPGEAKFVAWRHGPYPGSARFERPDGTYADKPYYPSMDIAVPHFSLPRCFLCPDGGNWLADMTLGDIHHGGSDETVIVVRTKQGQAVLDSARSAGKIAMEALSPEQIAACVIQQITRSKMLPAMACNGWLKKQMRVAPVFDYDADALLRGKMKWKALLWVWKYRLTFWVRTDWRRRFLLKHPAIMEKSGHFLYYFPTTFPGYTVVTKVLKIFLQVLKRKNGK